MGKKLGATQPLEIADYLAKSPIISSFRKNEVTERRVFQDRLVMTASISLRKGIPAKDFGKRKELQERKRQYLIMKLCSNLVENP